MVPEYLLPQLRAWFAERLGEPSEPQVRGWPEIRSGRHVLIAAPTGTGKTLAAFLNALDGLLRQGADLRDETQVLYVSPLRALGNDVQKNLQLPLEELRERDPELPEVRVLVRTGDTTQAERSAMRRRPPHILVTTPESLYILLTSEGGRAMLGTVRSVIVDEIHAVAESKRGSHLSLSLERLVALAGEVQRIGLSATQRPIEEIASFLVGRDRDCRIVDVGHLRAMDVAVEVPPSPLTAVCSSEVWDEIYERMRALIEDHRTTLVFVNTRKLAERVAARLGDQLGEDAVTCHHSSLSRDRRLDAERRLKEGSLRALVATASLELGIDIGDVDLVIQVGSVRRIGTFLQRVGRAGHGVGRTPRGRLFPLTRDELVEAVALFRAVFAGELDRTRIPVGPRDILAQHMVAACAARDWDEEALFEALARAWPYRDLARADFDALVALHSSGRYALLHRDGVGRRLRATRRARLVAVTSGGAIPDKADYRVMKQPEDLFVGSVDEDFAIESSVGDVFQLGNTSWRILRIERGALRVADAQGVPPSLPFWFGEAPARSAELSAKVSAVREHGSDPAWTEAVEGVGEGVASQVSQYLEEGRRVLGTVPTQQRVVVERFFDESGGMQLVIHAPFGMRVNRAWGLALRKRFCRGFGFELQAAANEEAIVLSLGPQHSFPLEEVFGYLHPNTAREVLVQAVLATPLFQTRWRWNAAASLLLPRMQGGSRIAPQIQRMRAQDLLAASFPEVMACGENLPAGDLPVPFDHPLVRQTIEDCLGEAMDVEGFLAVLRGLRDGSIATVAIDTAEPSIFCQGILNAAPYAFLDDAPLEERRTQAVLNRRGLDPRSRDEIGALAPEAVERVRQEAWPDPRSAEEVHETLTWMGFVGEAEAEPWRAWLAELAGAGRVARDGDRWFAVEASRDPREIWKGRLQALGPVISDDPELVALEREGFVLRVRLEGREQWCERRLLARIQRYTLEGLRAAIQPVSPRDLMRFLLHWQHVDPEARLEGPEGVRRVVAQLAGFEVPAVAWEKEILPARVQRYQRRWLDELGFGGEIAWGRLWGSGASPIRATPLALVPREELDAWLGLGVALDPANLRGDARELLEALQRRGPSFTRELEKETRLLPSQLEEALGELIATGWVSGDGYAGLRSLIVPPSRRRFAVATAGRWTLLRGETVPDPPSPDVVARKLLDRYGVVFSTLLRRERIPVPWRDLLRSFRRMELRGEVRGGRFVSGFSGEHFALPEAVTLLRKVRGTEPAPPLPVAACDPLNLRGILTPDERVPATSRTRITVG
jgi:ATP-dependent Lhr-like helicase